MRCLVVGDLHIDSKVGNKRTVDFFNKIKDMIIEKSKDVELVILLGDYFMTPNPENSYREVLSEFLSKIKKPKIALLGQHDRNLNGHVLQPIIPLADDLKIIETTQIYRGLTFISHNRDTKQLEQDIKAAKPGLVFGHFNINGYETDSIQLDSSIYVDMPKNKFYLGDIHKRQKAKNICYVGAVAPVDLSQLEYDFAVLILDTETGKEEWVPISYGTNVVKIQDEDDVSKINEMSRVIIKVKDKKEKAVWKAKLQDTNCLAIEFMEEGVKIKKQKLDVNVNFKSMVGKYLKMIDKEHLEEKINKYIERC